ncbi:hypothetical protein B0H63DRAFT_534814 [Podospora didyma]|uniref:Uncharacterized protein n=1 Tax=Podospora didyma TaxID=330526 RepID=A0AAE0K361_9PEZI|nr:hypothetical protein B0H63DRAFT_534814 [Podospora didyma]
MSWISNAMSRLKISTTWESRSILTQTRDEELAVVDRHAPCPDACVDRSSDIPQTNYPSGSCSPRICFEHLEGLLAAASNVKTLKIHHGEFLRGPSPSHSIVLLNNLTSLTLKGCDLLHPEGLDAILRGCPKPTGFSYRLPESYPAIEMSELVACVHRAACAPNPEMLRISVESYVRSVCDDGLFGDIVRWPAGPFPALKRLTLTMRALEAESVEAGRLESAIEALRDEQNLLLNLKTVVLISSSGEVKGPEFFWSRHTTSSNRDIPHNHHWNIMKQSMVGNRHDDSSQGCKRQHFTSLALSGIDLMIRPHHICNSDREFILEHWDEGYRNLVNHGLEEDLEQYDKVDVAASLPIHSCFYEEELLPTKTYLWGHPG